MMDEKGNVADDQGIAELAREKKIEGISDIRDDGEINILDIITLVQYVLYGELPGDNSTLETELLFK